MPAKILDGRKLAERIQNDVAEKVRARVQQHKPAPRLTVILVGEKYASKIYVAHKQKACKTVGIYSECHPLLSTTNQKTIEVLIDQLNQNPLIHGILLQLPLPETVNADILLERIDPKKDVDGLHPYNLGRLVQRRPLLRPCTPLGIMTLLKTTGENLSGKHAVVVGASNIVGRPMALELLMEKCTVTVCHSATKPLSQYVQSADILISATGYRGLIHSDWIKPGAIVIDVGIHRSDNGELTGDIDFDTARERASWITPVPGGVGPMTVAMLLQNTLMAAQ